MVDALVADHPAAPVSRGEYTSFRCGNTLRAATSIGGIAERTSRSAKSDSAVDHAGDIKDAAAANREPFHRNPTISRWGIF